MEIIKALALCHKAIKVDGYALYPIVTLHNFRTDAYKFGVQVAQSATVTFDTERVSGSVDGKITYPHTVKEEFLTLRGDIRYVEKAIVAFLGTKIVDELLNL